MVEIGEAAALARLESVSLTGARAGYVKLLVPLSFKNPEDLVETVKLLLSKDAGSVQAVRGSQAMVVSDFRANVEQVLELVDFLDGPTSEPVVEEVPLRHATPLAMHATLEKLSEARRQVTQETLAGKAVAMPESRSMLIVAPLREYEWWVEMIERFDRPEPIETLEYFPRRFGLAETAALVEEVVLGGGPLAQQGSFRMVRNDLTGSLMITATPAVHGQVQALFDRLEAREWGPRRVMRAYPIENRQVAEVHELLGSLLDAGVLERPGNELAGDVAGAASAATQGTGGRVTPDDGADLHIAADEATNRILAFGEPVVLNQLAALIAELDERHGQILVEARVVTLTEGETLDLGAELEALGSVGGSQGQLASLFGLGLPGAASAVLPPAGGTGGSAVVLDPGEFSVLVRALETVTGGRTLTIPKVLVNNNQEAQLDSVVQTPFAATNASDTVATTSFGGTMDAGTTISVKPQVADGDLIVLDYTVTISSFTGEAADPTLPPPRQQTLLRSVVTIPDGHTVVVGGLEIEAESDAESRVPLLGRIPVVGALFGNRSKSESRTRFWVFLRGTTVQGATFEQLRHISAPAFDAAGVDAGWPQTKPRIMR